MAFSRTKIMSPSGSAFPRPKGLGHSGRDASRSLSSRRDTPYLLYGAGAASGRCEPVEGFSMTYREFVK
jgi:hypothetical protein